MARQISDATAIDPDERVDFDLDVLVVEEENAPPFRFKYGGQVFEMPLMLGMQMEDQLALEDANTNESLQIIMGVDEFERLLAVRDDNDKGISAGRMQALIQAWHRHQGLESGESRASRRSSGSTARQSRRTSRSARR